VATDADAIIKLGNNLFSQGNYDEAIARFREALRLTPGNAAVHYNIGLALQRQGKYEQAVASYQHAIRIQPGLLVALNNLGAALKALDRLPEAVACYRQVLQLKPDYADVHANLGNALAVQDKLYEAVSSYQQALRLRPDNAQTHFNLGFALSKHGRAEEAKASFREALRLEPGYVEAHFNLGILFHEQGNLDQALTCYEQALRLDSGHALAHLNRALLWLARGDWPNGLPEFEWRWQTKDLPGYGMQQPRWDGSPLRGRTIFIFAEQGLGDTLHFIRYLPLVKQRGGYTIVECQQPLLRLLANFPGIDRLQARGSQLPECDVYAPLLSLPGIFGTLPGNVPAAVPYLQADAELVTQWRKELKAISGFKVGIAWQGNLIKPDDVHRSIPLTSFALLAAVPGVRLISLQKGPGMEQLRALGDRFPVIDLSNRLDEASGAFMDTAAVMKNLDLVISSDTAIPHLAGALAVPVWTALPAVPDWRWLLEREDSPWYPTMRLFRKKQHGTWEDVFDRMAGALKALVK
jgi:Flp pilus assembly protein TadD